MVDLQESQKTLIFSNWKIKTSRLNDLPNITQKMRVRPKQSLLVTFFLGHQGHGISSTLAKKTNVILGCINMKVAYGN